MFRIVFACAALVAAAFVSPVVHAHGGEDHSVPPTIAAPVARQVGFGADGSVFQVVIAQSAEAWVLYLADADSNVPVVNAAIDIEAGGWQGKATPTGSDGIYLLAWSPTNAATDVTVMVSAGGQDDLILVSGVGPAPPPVESASEQVAHWTHWTGGGAIGIALAVLMLLATRRRRVVPVLALLALAGTAQAHNGEDHGTQPAAAPVSAGVSIVMPKATQFLLGIRTERVASRQAADTVRVVGRVMPDPAGHARVQPSQPARVLADNDIPLPVAGQAVKRGQVLAVLEPTLSAIEKGDRRAALARIDSDLAIQEREVPRMEALASAIPFRTLETARIRLEQLRRERTQIAGTALGRELLIAPVDGIVTDVHLVPGEVVTSDRVLVEIVDPARLRIEAVVHDVDLASRISGATASSKLLPDAAIPLTKVGVSPRIDPVDQGIHALFSVAPEHAAKLRIGLPVDVYLATGATTLRTPVPRDALVNSGGRQVVFVRIAPESFEARPVVIHQIIGPLAEVAGIRDGDRVVVQGVEQIKAAR